MSTIERAIEMAAAAHAGQKGKNGEPYIFHPIRVMLAVKTDHERMAAVLHDVVEDSAVTLDDLSREGFPAEVVRAVDLLTKREGETREDAARKAVTDPIARVVKLADVTDNMDLSRISRPKKKDFERLAEYEKVKAILESNDIEEVSVPGDEPPPTSVIPSIDPPEAFLESNDIEAASVPGDETPPASVVTHGIDPRHPRIRINFSSSYEKAAEKLAYKYNDLGAVTTLYHDTSESGFSFRGRLCYFSSDPVTVSIAESLARDVSKIVKIHPRFVAVREGTENFVIYLIGKPRRRSTTKKPRLEEGRSTVNEEIVQCPQCPAKIRKGRLAGHINKAHNASKGTTSRKPSLSTPTDPPTVRVMPLKRREDTEEDKK